MFYYFVIFLINIIKKIFIELIMYLPPEVESGNKEYKLKVITESDERFEQLASQMKWRLNEGNGIAFYYLGVSDNGDIKNISIVNPINGNSSYGFLSIIINNKTSSTI